MKRLFLIAILAGTIGLISGADPLNQPAPAAARPEEAKKPELPRFDLDFPGGTPEDLVNALNKPLHSMLNVVIPFGAKDAQIPPLKLKNVTAAQVFQALSNASQRFTERRVGFNQTQQFSERYDFSTIGVPTENSVWSFRVERPGFVEEQYSYRFYQLGPYLEGLKVEDITTAIQTAIKMLDIEPGPTLKFHPETKLLIAVGKQSEFQLIDDVLKELGKGGPKPERLSEVLVNGLVNKPGNIALPKDQKLTILDAIGRAGGLKDNRAGNQPTIFFARPGQKEQSFNFGDLKKENDLGKIIYLEPGDVIDAR